MFQFHTGSIKSLYFDEGLTLAEVFQFHTGSIKSVSVQNTTYKRGKFQFHTGSIKRLASFGMWVMFEHVSIPYWFD